MKLSIITINLNNKSGLRKTIESVVNQTFTNYEYIIIDGGSKDGSVEVIKEYADIISLWISESDKGIYNAMNKGIIKSSGSFLQFLNSGDYFLSQSILNDTLINNADIRAEILYTDCFATSMDDNMKRIEIPNTLSLLYLIDHSLCHPGTFISRKTFEEIGLYNEEYKILSDKDFFIKAFLSGIEFKKVNLPSIVVEPNGISQTDNKLLNEEMNKMILNNFGEQYLDLYFDRMGKCNQLSFLEKSRIVRYFLKHHGNYFINKFIRF